MWVKTESKPFNILYADYNSGCSRLWCGQMWRGQSHLCALCTVWRWVTLSFACFVSLSITSCPSDEPFSLPWRSYMLFIWLLIIPWPTAQTERERSLHWDEGGGGVVVSQHPLHTNPHKSAGRSTAYHTRRSVVSSHEGERDMPQRARATVQRCPILPNWFLMHPPPRSQPGPTLCRLLFQGRKRPSDTPPPPKSHSLWGLFGDRQLCGHHRPLGIDALRRGRGVADER